MGGIGGLFAANSISNIVLHDKWLDFLEDKY